MGNVAWVSEGALEPSEWNTEPRPESLSGTFSVVLDRTGKLEHGLRGLSIDAALAWANRRAKRVIVEIGDAGYSAGTTPVVEYEPLSDSVRGAARARAPAYLSRTKDEAPIRWSAGVTIAARNEPHDRLAAERDMDRVIAAIARHRATGKYAPERMQGLARGGVVTVTARTHEQAANAIAEIEAVARMTVEDGLGAASYHLGVGAPVPAEKP